jgi:hypothetical protein
MTENWNRAMELARGDYVCILGHDDGLNPAIVDAVRWAANCDAKAIVFPFAAVYFWPDFPIERNAGRLFLGSCSRETTRVSAKQELTRFIRSHCGLVRLPRIYHGVVHRECLEAIRRKNGQYFETPAADDHFSYALCTMIRDYYYLDFPGTIAGKCSGSNSGLFAVRGDGHVHLSRYRPDEIVSDRRAPPVSKTESFKVSALIAALERCGANQLIDAFVDGPLYAVWYAHSLRNAHGAALASLSHLWVRALQGQSPMAKLRVMGHVGGAALRLAANKVGRKVIESLGGYPLMISGSAEQTIHAARNIAEAAAIVGREYRTSCSHVGGAGRTHSAGSVP